MSLIEVKDLKKNYVNEDVVTPVLHGLTFTIDKGEFVAIMGPSGSGKSTLMHILSFLDRPTSGLYQFEGTDTKEFPDDYLAELRNERIGFVFQSFNLLARTSVLDNVKLPLLYSKKKNQDKLAKDALASVGLSHRLDFYTNQISGGEKQRVAIARAIISQPEILILDEPTASLDGDTGKMIIAFVKEKILNKNRCIIIVTHDARINEYADRILRMEDGVLTATTKGQE